MVSPDEIQHVRSKSECVPSECVMYNVAVVRHDAVVMGTVVA